MSKDEKKYEYEPAGRIDDLVKEMLRAEFYRGGIHALQTIRRTGITEANVIETIEVLGLLLLNGSKENMVEGQRDI